MDIVREPHEAEKGTAMFCKDLRIVEVKPTDEDVRDIDAAFSELGKKAATFGLQTNAVYERRDNDGELDQSWCLTARLVMRDVRGDVRAVEFGATIPFRPMSIEQAQDRWREVLTRYIVNDFIPQVMELGGDE